MWSIAILLLFFSAMPIIAHTSSYRPDNWVLFFSVLAAYILIVSPERVKTLILLAIIPVVTFYIKATGLYIGIAVFINLLLADRLRDAVRYALLFFTFFGLTVVALHFGTDGAFSSGLTTGAQVKYSWFLAIQCLSVSQLWIFIILPILIGTHLRHSNTIFRKEQIVLLTFFMVSLITGVITSRRLGANSYYYLDCFTFGIVISIGWLAHYCQNLSKLKFSNPQNTALAALILLFIFQSFPSTNEIQGFLQGRLPQDIALYRTKLYQDDREKLSELCNQNKLKCFSDDEGLNVMLDNPQIIFPMVQTMLIQSGLLNIASIVSPVERQEYDIIALTGSQWKYFNVDPFPKEFKESLSLNYQEFRTPFKYHIFRPKNIKNN
ncbi:MAG: hypothetical protein VR64_24155 [Desulfatitalea sp. BRH_c12]|nr:MAG: hypothetical protein VR64_24155 [Desulfatitalea sp. BRH_c12]